MKPAHSLVVVVGAMIETDLELERRVLTGVGADVVDATPLSHEEASQLLSTATGVLTSGFFDFDFAAMPRCRAISLYSIGVDALDVEAATEAGIVVANTPGYCVDEVADQTLTLLLAVWRKLDAARAIAQSPDWTLDGLGSIPRLRGRTLGLIGFGAIARAVAARARGFGLEVVAHDAFLDRSSGEAAGVRLLSLDEVLDASDALSLHVPLTEETAGMIARPQLARLRPGAVLVNTSRGGLVDEDALLDALDAGRLAGAGLDVLASEPPSQPTSLRLAGHPRVVCTPHMGYLSDEALRDLRRIAAESLAALLRGERPASLVNPAALAKR